MCLEAQAYGDEQILDHIDCKKIIVGDFEWDSFEYAVEYNHKYPRILLNLIIKVAFSRFLKNIGYI